MSKIIPAILSNNEQDFSSKINNDELINLVDFLQIDILDGSLFNATSFHQPSAIPNNLPCKIELHLMVINPEIYIESWSSIKQVSRVYIHAEIDSDLSPILQKIKKLNWQAGIAINPETKLSQIEYYLDEVDCIMLMGVEPGASGRPFAGKIVYEKLHSLKENHPNLLLAVDGGISSENINLLSSSGAENFCIGSQIWQSGNPAENYQKLASKIN